MFIPVRLSRRGAAQLDLRRLPIPAQTARALTRNFPVAMLTAHALSPEALKRSFDMGARAYLPKEKLGEIVPFLEDVLTHEYLPGWKRLMEKLKGFFDQRFESGWEKKAGMDWREWASLSDKE